MVTAIITFFTLMMALFLIYNPAIPVWGKVINIIIPAAILLY